MEPIEPFAFRSPPLPDELLSSWILRTAHGLLMKPYDFCHTYWRSRPPVLTRDIDRMAPESILVGMAEGSRVPIDRVRQTTLRAYDGFLFNGLNEQGFAPWIMPVGVRHRARMAFGLQYCPVCLDEDAVPYFRRRWRIATSSVCVQHGVLLADRCPECGESIAPHRSRQISRCWKCLCALNGAKTRTARPDVVKLQATFELALKLGWASLGESVVHYSPQYFLLVRQLLLLIARGPRRDRFEAAIAGHKWANRMSGGPFEQARGVEYLTPSARHDHFERVAFLLWAWPEIFVETAQTAGLWRSWALKDMDEVPWNYHRVVRDFLT